MISEESFIVKDYQLIPYHIKLCQPWCTASTALNSRQGFLVKLIVNENLTAIGECAPMTAIGTESLSQAQDFLQQQLPQLIKQPLSIASLADMQQTPACRFALETALLSLQAQQLKVTLSCLLKPENCQPEQTQIRVNTMLGHIDATLPSRARQAEQQGFKCLKIKMGLAGIEAEAENLQQLLTQLAAATVLRLDANKSWTVAETQWLLQFLAPYTQQIDSIEEPLRIFNAETYQMLQNSTDIKLALDESFSQSGLNHFPLRQLVIKPMAQGGLLPSLTLARQAQKAKINIVITSSIETAHGLWAISHLCAAIDNQQFHGLATASWLEDSLIKAPGIKHGIIAI